MKEPLTMDDVREKDFFQNRGLLIVKNNLPF
jgi:hypothetical protein